MPRYCYTTRAGAVIKRFYAYPPPATIRVRDGRGRLVRARRDISAEHEPTQRVVKAPWPLISQAAGVHPAQIPQAREEAKRLGVPVEFTRDGRVIFRDRKQRKAYCRAIGLVDRTGFGTGGDP